MRRSNGHDVRDTWQEAIERGNLARGIEASEEVTSRDDVYVMAGASLPSRSDLADSERPVSLG